jgi:phosphatidylglycerol---prolipoprotein diacylglyceryl transferase
MIPAMLTHPQFDPIALDLTSWGLPIQVHWYGLTYLVAFLLFLWLASRRVAKPWFAEQGWSRRDVEDILFYGVLGVIIGGRLGYVLFYKPAYYLAHPLEVFYVWRGGMAFHGGLLGVVVALWIYARLHERPYLQLMDLIAPCVPTGLASGRIGNFINGELWGRVADPTLPWAMVFPQAQDGLTRHPSQLYQFLLEGLLLFGLMWWGVGAKRRPWGQVSAAFLMGYGSLRFVAEYFREPDSFLGLLSLGMSMGQWLCLPMILLGWVLWIWAARPKGHVG